MVQFKDMHIIHRGSYSYKYPENSIPAFREALSNHKMIELDLHILKDDTVVVFHDDNLKRMCNVDLKIKNLTYEEIKKYKLNGTMYEIPTFKEVLDLVGGHVLLDIELKYDVNGSRLPSEVIKILKDYNGEFLLKSFDPRIVRRLKSLRRKYKMKFNVGLLINDTKSIIPFVVFCNPDFVSFSYKNFDKKLFRFISNVKPTLLYTIKSKEEFSSINDFKGGYIVENYEKIFYS